MTSALSAVHDDDALLDMIGGDGGAADLPGEPLVRLLTDWRAQVNSLPAAELVDVDLALDIVRRNDT